MLEKLKFWEHKEEEPLFPSQERYPTGIPDSLPGTPEPRPQFPGFASETAPPRPLPQPSPFPSLQPRAPEVEQPKDLEIISLKLDAIKNALESVNMRLERLENVIVGKSEREQRRVWYK